jgi:hypothetical protein
MDDWYLMIQFVCQFAEGVHRTRRGSGCTNSEHETPRTN